MKQEPGWERRITSEIMCDLKSLVLIGPQENG